MPTRPKIKIKDNSDLRNEIDELYEVTEQSVLAKWAIMCAKHVLTLVELDDFELIDIDRGIKINELWQERKASVHEVRQAGFKVHAIARNYKTELAKTAVRSVGQAIGVGHMKEHAMVCSDYAIKTVQLAFPDDEVKITEERRWQLEKLVKINPRK